MKQIIVDIGPDGAVIIDAKDFQGVDCEQATRFLEEALGSVVERQHKPEYRQQRRAGNTRQQQVGR
jgi:hypothetical protein